VFRFILLGLLLLVMSCSGVSTEAADLPLSSNWDQGRRAKPPGVRKKIVEASSARAKKNASIAVHRAKLPKTVTEPQVTKQDARSARTAPTPVAVPSEELELSWFLDTVVANVDGPKREDSASLEGNLIVSEPGVVSSPYMVIELSGHIVKTPETVARVDIRIGSVQRSVNWSADEIKSGRFSIALDAPMQAGALPGYFPVSVVALVWRDGKQGTAMVSLEKVRVRLGKVALVAQQ
jgi:hypothetical protein